MDNQIKTQDLYLATYLKFNCVELLRLELMDNIKKVSFVFARTEKADKLLSQYYSSSNLMEKTLLNTFSELKFKAKQATYGK
jgi:ABC-type Fe3+-hydroxamate transport system substrate-binding protein